MRPRLDPEDVRSVVARVRARFPGEGRPPAAPSAPLPRAEPGGRTSPSVAGDGIHPTIDAAVDAAWNAFLAYRDMGLDRRIEIVARIRDSMRRHGADLARRAWEETGLGRYEDKVEKNALVTEKTPGPEDLEPQARSGDRGLVVTELAPFGVVAAITPTTNPTATIINNTIAVVSAGNGLVFNVHPNAKRVSVDTVPADQRGHPGGRRTTRPRHLRAGADPRDGAGLDGPSAGADPPRHRWAGCGEGGAPDVEASHHRGPRQSAGGGRRHRRCRACGKEIVRGASFDNNVICTDEKEVFVVDSVAERLLRSMQANGGVLLKDYQREQLDRVIFKETRGPGKPGKINPEWIGQNAGKILARSASPRGTRSDSSWSRFPSITPWFGPSR